MRDTYIIAELGNTHEGSLGLAKQMILAAADSGANAVKFQTHIFEKESLLQAPNPTYFTDESRKEYFERTSFTLTQLQSLKQFSEKQCKVDFLSSPFSVEAVEFLEKLEIKTYKIPSGEVTNTLLLERVAKSGKKVLLSSGMNTWSELDGAVNVLRENGCKDLVVLQCTSKYPCPPEDAGLNVLGELRERYNVEVGFSDHTLGPAIPLAAVALGAVIIEKHFTLSKLMYGSDAKNSMEPAEFKSMVEYIREIDICIKNKVTKKGLSEDLLVMKAVFEKSIVSTCEIKKGEIITKEHISVKKPGDGIPVKYYQYIIGKTALCRIEKDTKLTPLDIDDFAW